MTDYELIYNHTIFHAYFCHLIETGQADSTEELCEIGLQLEEEINRRSIADFQIEQFIKSAHLEPQDRLMVNKYIFPDMINAEAGHS